MIRLRRMTHHDYPLLLAWLAEPHVKEWWNDGDDTLEKVERHYSEQSATNERFIILHQANGADGPAQPIGYMQYEIDQDGIANIDQFIGIKTMLGQGIGTKAIHLLLDHIRSHHQLCLVTVDPAPANQRAIRCYEKVGFCHDPSLPNTSDGEAYMMKIEYPLTDQKLTGKN